MAIRYAHPIEDLADEPVSQLNSRLTWIATNRLFWLFALMLANQKELFDRVLLLTSLNKKSKYLSFEKIEKNYPYF